METKANEDISKRLYEDFEPYCKWITNEGQKILEVDLKGFKKEQLKVQTNNKGVLKIYGEKPLSASSKKKWSRFHKEIRVSKDCEMSGIQAKFSQGILSIVLPKSEATQHAKDVATIEKHSLWGVQKRKRTTIQIVLGIVAVVALGTYVARILGNKHHYDAFDNVNVVNI
ncbi:unnamed protein product [Vicia faba]|uniref:SHSP domain-containing protein n=1 Tax=Vicia faba TaxID=3906 RepID=A0AAV0Z7Q0_VICFA|nr:unnamed protein product [Vicia faba]